MKFFHRSKSDKGASNTISFIVIILFIMTLLISFIDVGLYFNVKNQMQSAAENGARSVALYGGTDTVVRYWRGGVKDGRGTRPVDLVYNSIPDIYKGKPAGSIVTVQPAGVACFPTAGKINAGDQVWCEVTYVYNGLAGRFGIFNLGRGAEAIAAGMTVRGTSVSEVTIE